MKQKKVILILIDGMRPDGLLTCKNPYVDELIGKSYYTLNSRTVMPSQTLTCHMSLFHSVTAERHGIITNDYMPMVRPLNGLFEQLHNAGKTNAFYYGWGPLRDIARPRTVDFSEHIQSCTEESSDTSLTDSALTRIKKSKPDFVFLYMGETDDKGGHQNGWMSDEYLRRISIAIDNARRIINEFSDEYAIIITADHGGHDRTHGTAMDEDMLIPNLYIGKDFEAGKQFQGGSILDIAPTIAKIIGIDPAPEWEGKSVI